MIKTLRFCKVIGQTPKEKWMLSPGERMSFVDTPCVPFYPQKVVALAMHNGDVRQLPVREVHIGGVAWLGDDRLYRKFSVSDEGLIEVGAFANVAVPFRAIVENTLPVAVRPKLAITGEGHLAGSEKGPRETYVSGLMPEVVGSVSKRFVIGEQAAVLMQEAGCTGKIRRITMRSNSELDVDVIGLQVANVSLNIGASGQPIEFFKDGWETPKSLTLEPWIRLTVALQKTCPEERWVEIDVDIDVEEEKAEEGKTS
jgi:hypothetical protein